MFHPIPLALLLLLLFLAVSFTILSAWSFSSFSICVCLFDCFPVALSFEICLRSYSITTFDYYHAQSIIFQFSKSILIKCYFLFFRNAIWFFWFFFSLNSFVGVANDSSFKSLYCYSPNIYLRTHTHIYHHAHIYIFIYM